MIRILFVFIALNIHTLSAGQTDARITTIDFVEILRGNDEEAKFYYENNWKVLREMALLEGYIQSYEILETTHSKDAPFHLMLITTYKNKVQYDFREDNFGELIEKRGEVKLLNKKEPSDFRKIVFYKEGVRHVSDEL